MAGGEPAPTTNWEGTDVSTGAPAWDRFIAGFKSGPEGRVNFYKKRYGESSVRTSPGGDIEFLKPGTNQWAKVDEEGLSWKDLADLVFPAVAAQATFVRRGIVRREESTAFSQQKAEIEGHPADAADPTDARRTLLELNTYVDHDTGYVPWGDLTGDQHEARIDFLERKMWGINVTVDRHRLAVKLIKNEGVSCLNDLPSIPDEFWEGMA